MKLFKRIFVILIILITILIYYKFENKKINYVAINITEKENYSDYFVKNIKKLGKFNKILETKMSSEELLEDIDNNIEILEDVTIQNIINSASIITIMLNPNEIYRAKTYNELEIIINNINQIEGDLYEKDYNDTTFFYNYNFISSWM